ncbi:hypothetical protein J5N97_000902 [Dioscorea zingiberensis]|uniref:Uncharacterized protein n=1 Tax=Dioscorea zingiberensis TaxID=325984 RepID=A0A9D5H2S7_9LILI|nr:hypothetical protein J5N97_000902 [Dioscorea zingiberensis]
MANKVFFLIAFALLFCFSQGGNGQTTRCNLSNIGINQTRTGVLVNGVDEYAVVISNNCACPQSSVLLKCAGFSTVENVDPSLFKPVGDDQCSVNNGRPLVQGSPITFNYAWASPQVFLPAGSVINCPSSRIKPFKQED